MDLKMRIFIRNGQEQDWSEENVVLLRLKESSANLGESCRVSGAHQRLSWVRLKWPSLSTRCSLPQEGYTLKQGGSLQLRQTPGKLTAGGCQLAPLSGVVKQVLPCSLGSTSLHLPQNTAKHNSTIGDVLTSVNGLLSQASGLVFPATQDMIYGPFFFPSLLCFQ